MASGGIDAPGDIRGDVTLSRSYKNPYNMIPVLSLRRARTQRSKKVEDFSKVVSYNTLPVVFVDGIS